MKRRNTILVESESVKITVQIDVNSPGKALSRQEVGERSVNRILMRADVRAAHC
jgi:hypothetical protein